MIKNFAKFSATMGKGFKVGESDVEIKLTLPLKVVQDNFMFLSTNQGEKINVFLGDPQAAMDLGDEDAMYRLFTGHRVTTDQSGVVTRIEKTGDEPEQDDNQAQMFGPDGEPIQPEESTGEGQKSENEQPTVPPTDGEDPGTDPNDPYGDNDDNDIPDWMKDGGDDQSGSKEMDFTSEGGEGEPKSAADPQHAAQEDPPAADKATPPVEIGKEELEMFILNKRPIFEDIKLADAPADFPSLLQQRNEGKTWMEISKEINVPSGQISTKYGAYKKRVTKMMQDGVAV